MNDRIALVRSNSGLTQEKFAAKLGLSQNFVWMLEKGTRIPSERTISDICREFNVNETWLRTGEGEMLIPMDREKEIMAFIGDILKGEPDFRRALVHVLARMTPDQWEMMEAKARELLEEMETPPQDGGGVRQGSEVKLSGM